MKTYNNLTVLTVTLSLATSVTFALVGTSQGGKWPDTWPKQLEPLREQAKTVEVMHGIQETVYEIPFVSREEFEKAWPFILKLKSKGAPVILEKSPSTYSASGSTMATGVRILWPCGGTVPLPDGTKLAVKPPWPDSARSGSGDLPEYVVVENGNWIPFTGGEPRGFLYRARVDIMLVMDVNIMDLNRIPLPADTPIIDKRFDGAAAAKPAAPLVFGPLTNGLQAAAEVSADEPFQVRFHIRNASAPPAIIAGNGLRQDAECIVEDEQGHRVEVTKTIPWFTYFTKRDKVERGGEIVFPSGGLSFLRPRGCWDYPNYTAQAKPGRYTVRFQLHFPLDYPGEAKPGDWRGGLETAPVTIEVKEPNVAAQKLLANKLAEMQKMEGKLASLPSNKAMTEVERKTATWNLKAELKALRENVESVRALITQLAPKQ